MQNLTCNSQRHVTRNLGFRLTQLRFAAIATSVLGVANSRNFGFQRAENWYSVFAKLQREEFCVVPG